METLKKNWAFIFVAGVSILLGVLAMLTALRLRRESPVAPTAPTQQLALEGSPVPACALNITFNQPGATPSPTPTLSPSPTPALSFGVTKTVDRSSALPNDTITYTVVLQNSGATPVYDAFFEETLPQYTTYKSPSMSCSYTPSGGSAQARSFEIDNLADGLDTTADPESTALRNFRVAGSLVENNNPWDLNSGDIITCNYQATVDNNAPNGTNLTNNVVGHSDTANGDQAGETDLTGNGSTTVTVGQPSTPVISVVKTADRATANTADLINYTVKVTNTSSVAAYDVFFEENLSSSVTYQAPSMSCSKVLSGQSSGSGFEIDNLVDGFDTTPDSESVALRTFRVAGSLTENNNTWDLPNNGDYITCTYRVRVNDGVAAGTNLVNTIVGKGDNKNGNQPNQTQVTGTDSRTVVVAAPAQCNVICTTSSQCPSNLTCYIAAGQSSGNCRTPACPTADNCGCPQASASPSPTPPGTTPVVPRAGNELPTIALISVGIILLFLGFAL